MAPPGDPGPHPPFRRGRDPAYDDRLARILHGLARRTGLDLDIRPLLYQAESTRSSSRSERDRLSPLDLRQVYRLKPELALPEPSVLALFDDLLTSGAHFRAAKDLLQERWPGVPVVGIFLARRALTTGR